MADVLTVYEKVFATLPVWGVITHEAKVGKGFANVTVHPVAVAPAVTSPHPLFPVTVGDVPQEERTGGVLEETIIPKLVIPQLVVVAIFTEEVANLARKGWRLLCAATVKVAKGVVLPTEK